MRRHLVIARVGRNSLHRTWLESATDRNWDLYLCPFQAIADQSDVQCKVGEVIAGPKWTGLTALLSGWDGWKDYDSVWLPDDDILADQATISAMFDVGELLNFNLFAPGLHERSYYAHYITMTNRSFFARRVGFVEIMMPCFRTAVLSELLPTFALSTTGWGWGLDSVWPKLLGYEGLGIIDGVSVLHTRRVGQFRDAELRRRVNEESDYLLQRHSCGQEMATFAGIDSSLVEQALSPDELLVRLVSGWSYLFDNDARVLRWIVEHQRSSFEWPNYLIEGAPSGPSLLQPKPLRAATPQAALETREPQLAQPITSAHHP
jgi:hypothetical protein